MEEMRFKYEGEFIESLKIMEQFTGRTEDELIEMGYKTGNKKILTLDGLEYKVYLQHGNNKSVRESKKIPTVKPRINYYHKVKTKQTGKTRRKVFSSNIVYYDEVTYLNKRYYINDNELPKKEIAVMVGLSIVTLNNLLNNVKSMDLNGYSIKTEIIGELYQDVVYYENNSYSHKKYFIDNVESSKNDIAKIVGMSVSTLDKLLVNVKEIAIRGYIINIEKIVMLYTVCKDGVTHEGLTLKQCEKLTGLGYQTLNCMKKTKAYSKKDGWRVL